MPWPDSAGEKARDRKNLLLHTVEKNLARPCIDIYMYTVVGTRAIMTLDEKESLERKFTRPRARTLETDCIQRPEIKRARKASG